MTPKNLISLTISSSDISILIWTFVFIYFLLPNKITLVLLIFNDNLLTLIHSFNFFFNNDCYNTTIITNILVRKTELISLLFHKRHSPVFSPGIPWLHPS